MFIRSHSSSCKALLCFVIITVTAFLPLNAQDCFIGTDENFKLSSQPRTSNTALSRTYFDRIAWTDIDQLLLPDRNCSALLLDSNQKSQSLIIQNFDFDIPHNARIKGIEARFSGSKSLNGTIQDYRIYLLDDEGRMVGKNKANKAIKGSEWNQQNSVFDKWTYGSQYDNWAYEWTPEVINSENFGISIELQNRSSQQVQVFLDQVLITVYYEAAIDLCDNDYYIALHSYPDPSVKSYEWQVPPGLNVDEAPEHPNLINIMAHNSTYGSYEICLTRTYNSGHSEQCCTAFDYRNCDKASIGDFVWHDLNGNGLQDSGEPGMNASRVQLYDESMNFIKETETVNGQYILDDLDPGNYFIRLFVPDMLATRSTDTDNLMNSDFFEFIDERMSRLIELEPGEHFKDVDFGLANRSSIYGMTWIDKNANGAFETGDGFLEDTEVQLYDSNGELLKIAISSREGDYSFDELLPGRYTIVFEADNAFYASPEALDSDIDEDEFSIDIELGFNENRNVNAGFYRLSSLSGTSWLDSNMDGVFDSGDTELEDIELLLYDCDDNYISRTSSDSNGAYLFENLVPGEYYLCAETNRSDIYIPKSIECSACMVLNENEAINGNDFIFNTESGAIELVFFKDFNADGEKNTGEEAYENLEVRLMDCNNSEISAGRSDNNGELFFDPLVSGEYMIEFDLPDNFFLTPGQDFELDAQTYLSECLEINARTVIEIALVGKSSIGDLVWHDKNNNGMQDSAEMGLEAVEIKLYDEQGELLDMISSDQNGNYRFDALLAGRYYLEVHELESLFEVTQANSGNDAENSDFYYEGNLLKTDIIELPWFTENTDLDLGLISAATSSNLTISGTVWRDSNGDLDQVSEQSLEDILVSLFHCDGSPAATELTDNSGRYSFTGLEEDRYYLSFELPLDFNMALTGDGFGLAVDADGNSACFDIATENLEIEAALIPVASVGDLVWLDANVNGQQDSGETGVRDIELLLLDSNENIIDQALSSEDGSYLFAGLTPGEYRIELLNADELYSPTLQALGPGSTDSELRLAGGRYISEFFTVFDGLDLNDIDLGLSFHQSIIGGTVFDDSSKDGIRNGVEKGLEAVRVELYDSSDNLLQSTTTDNGGIYRFYNVFNGTYYLKFILMDGFVYAPDNMGGDELFDSDVADVNGNTALIDVKGSTVIEGVNAGFIRTQACISGIYWVDTNENGIWDAEASAKQGNPAPQKSMNPESGLSGALVSLYNENGTIVATTVTDANGRYLICDLAPGTYYLNFESIPGFVFTSADLGTDDRFDSDVIDALGNTAIFEIENDMSIFGLNAGIHEDMQKPVNEPGENNVADTDTGSAFTGVNNTDAVHASALELESESDIAAGISIRKFREDTQQSVLYPNPLYNGNLHLGIPESEIDQLASLQLISADGSRVQEIKSNPADKEGLLILNIQETTTGVYYLRVNFKNRTENHRLVIFSP